MHKSKEFNKRKAISIYLEEDEKKKLKPIIERENKSESHVCRKIVMDYAQKHAAGNDSYTLGMWNENGEFMALPALLETRVKWSNYVKSESSEKNLRDVLNQCNFITERINQRLQEIKDKSPETKRINDIKLAKFVRNNDIRYKNPKNLGYWDKIRQKELLDLCTPEQRQEFEKAWKNEV